MTSTKLNSAVCQLQNIKWTQLRSLKTWCGLPGDLQTKGNSQRTALGTPDKCVTGRQRRHGHGKPTTQYRHGKPTTQWPRTPRSLALHPAGRMDTPSSSSLLQILLPPSRAVFTPQLTKSVQRRSPTAQGQEEDGSGSAGGKPCNPGPAGSKASGPGTNTTFFSHDHE